MNYSKILSLFFRAVTILGRFLLTYLITKKISLELQGEFTLISTTISLLVLLLGFDFYVFSTRKISINKEEPIFVFKNQFVIHTIVFFTFALVFLLCMFFLKLPLTFTHFLFIIAILFFEHLGQELFRLYLILEKVLLANILLFFKSGIWALLIAGYIFFFDINIISIGSILLTWLFFSIISVVFGLFYFPKINTFFKIKIDKIWIKNGVKVGLYLFMSTVALKIVEYSDRYLISYFLNIKDLGIYSFYFQLYNLFNVAMFTLVISFVFPKIFNAAGEDDFLRINKYKKEILRSTFLFCILYILIFYFSIEFLLDSIGKVELYKYQNIFYLLLFGGLFMNMSYAYHYILMAKNKDKIIIITNILTAALNVLLNLFFIPLFGIVGAAISFFGSAVILFCLKLYFYKKT